ncbi:MAG: hypothetical protein PHN47_03215 [Clostridia bacterium]|nr:hypothetical protein [Clostridia bacterium]
MTEQILNYYSYLLIYAFIGWCSECTYCSIPEKHFINRGFLNGPLCPIYGFGALLIIVLLMPFSIEPVLVFFLGILVTSALEYFTSYFMEKIFHAKWWDYSTYPYNLNGRICLKNSFFFGIMCLIAIYLLHPLVTDWVAKVPFNAKLIFLSAATLIIAVDMTVTVYTMLKLNGKLAQIAAIRKEFEELVAAEGVQGLADMVEDRFKEKLSESRLENLAEKLTQRLTERLSEKISIWQSRLLQAFPDLKFNRNNEHFKALNKAVEEKKQALKQLKEKHL